jgi:phage terminase small subunit
VKKKRKAPAIVRQNKAASKAWREIWALLEEKGLASDVYAPTVAIWAVELGLAEEAANAIFLPIDAKSGERVPRTLEQYLAGRNSQTAQELTLLRDALKHAGSLAAQFGASPLAQKRAGTGGEEPKESPMMEYIKLANSRRKREVS